EKPLEVLIVTVIGSVQYWVAEIQPCIVLYDMDGVSEELGRYAFNLAARMLPFNTSFVSRTVM
ncbi:ribosomal protein L16, partial [Pseudoalteromonas sp. S1612]|uniref:ribosomal protein L16 n=1 Tax=Pseudoalteromonas sp. S1612 TaxID=579507 RepID=UPI0012703C12